MAQVYANNARSTLAGSILIGATTVAVQGGDAAKFPSPAPGDFFLATMVDGSGNREIVKCTNRTGVTLTIVRGQESTTPFAFASGANIDCRMTAGTFSGMRDDIVVLSAEVANLSIDVGNLSDDVDFLSSKGGDIASAALTNLATATGRLVHITGSATITGLGTLPAGTERELVFDAAPTLTHHATSLILPGGANIVAAAGDVALMVSEGSGNWRCAAYQRAAIVPLVLTPWVAFTPTFTALGVVTGIFVMSRKVGDTLQLRGKFTVGTPIASEARMTLGFNGTNANINSDASKVPTIQFAGSGGLGVSSAAIVHLLIEGGVGYLTFGSSGGGLSGLQKGLGNNLFGASTTYSFMAEIPIAA